MGHVDFGGVVVHVCLEYVPELQVGEYAIVHVGFALHRIDESEAQRTWQILAELGLMRDALSDLQPTTDHLGHSNESPSQGHSASHDATDTSTSSRSNRASGAMGEGGVDALLR